MGPEYVTANFTEREKSVCPPSIYYLDKIESLNVLTRVLRDHRADHEMLHTARVGITSGWFTT